MAIGDPYVSLAEFKEYLSIPAGKISLDLSAQIAIDSASEEVERMTNRQFNKATVATARVYRPERCGDLVKVDDFWTTDGLVVEIDTSGTGTWVTVSASDYEVSPENGIVDGQPGWPFFKIHRSGGVRYPLHRWQGRRASVRVTAQWGWAEVPGPVKSACNIIGSETFNMKDAPFGVAGMDMFGPIRVRDNRVASSKLSRYAKDKLLIG